MQRRPKRWLRPVGVERDYVRGIGRVAVAPLIAAVNTVLFPALDLIAAQFRQDVDPRDMPPTAGWLEEVRVALIATLEAASVPDATIRSLVASVFTRTDTFNNAQFHAVLRSVYGVDVITSQPSLQTVMRIWEAENIALIKSIPVQSVSRIQGKITEAVRTGQTLKSLKDQIRSEFGIAERRAELIARDQVGKLNGQLTQERQESIGVESYTWRGVMDSRERDDHVDREGVVFRWDDPPDDGHPGEPIRCRCTAEPVLPSWEELEFRFTGVMPPSGTY